ncbi:dihydroorotate dehydrogenase electron transfer subunit [Sedimentibacter sp. MB31-C6]|uniref:dihydroorotate dehydrogenase electron transfer subunit n=1 Tax=Sedimentibacter sp. MB31-C6 TaxID=3109366 RepID=UPI002DDCB65B|nr:dihydroorotate dehydrogenase electron transfer subunit [Sedimentibacter sp. MB36-C1]WSI05482.1 dihydroorotate dehydrogenase electron transfer subunit [Sedimentibacter sp. MB36-C1]
MKVQKGIIIENKCISDNIYKLSVEYQGKIIPGQFFMLKTLDNSFLLPRPISVNDVNEKSINFLYRIEGIGTTKISTLKKNDKLQLFGPLGNGFEEDKLNGQIAVIGGGIGIAPLLYLTKILGKKADVYLGYKEKVYIDDEFKKYANSTTIVTEDGSIGEKGFVTDYVDFCKYDTVVTCGPEIMMNKIVDKCKENKVKCYVSLERRMACGMGVCLGCTVETIYGNKKACKDGPVFSSEEII